MNFKLFHINATKTQGKGHSEIILESQNAGGYLSKISLVYQAVGFLFFGTLIFFCWYYWKERMLLFDGAFYDFRLLESGKFNTGPGRLGDVIGEIVPWLLFKTGSPLSAIILSHSVGLMVFHYLIFLFITLKLKNYGAGLAVMLVSCIAYAHAFYIPFLQVNEALVLGVLFWAFIHPEIPFTSQKQKWWYSLGAFLSVVLMTFFHPLSIFLIIFVLGVEFIAFKRYRDKQLWLVAGLGLLWFVLKFKFLFVNNYEQDKLVPIGTIIHELPGIGKWPSTIFILDFIKSFRSLKWLGIICLLFTLRKGILFFLFTVLWVAVFTLIFLGTFYTGTSSLLYEDYFIIYGFFIAVLFVALFYHPVRKNLILLIALPFLWVGISRIYRSHYQFSNRLAYLSRVVNEAKRNGMKKCFIDYKCYPVNYADGQWDFAFESLLYSSLSGPDSSVTLFIKDDSFDSVCSVNRNRHNILFGVHFSPLWFGSDDMPQTYLHLPSTGYADLTTPQDDSSFHDSLFSSNNVKIIPLVQTVYARSHDWTTVIPVKIENTSGFTIPAIPKSKSPVELTYHLYDKNGSKLNDNIPTPFETDVKKEACSGVIVYLPLEKGVYYAKPDIITGNKHWWNIPCPSVKIILD